jgi:hypothetical protein
VLRGARATLSSPHPPAICFEFNPLTMGEVGVTPEQLQAELCDYRLFYIDCFDDHQVPCGQEIEQLSAITWVCNLFALPRGVSDELVRSVFAAR